jgi:predicted peptidase
MSRWLSATAALLFLFALLDECHAEKPAPGIQVCQTFVSPTDESQQISYLLFLPCGYCQAPEQGWPLMLFLHGSGERGTGNLPLVKKHGPPKLVETNRNFPFVVVSPQCPKETHWGSPAMLKLLSELLVDLTERFSVDANRICATGLSMGGGGAWMLAMTYPDRICAIAPMCGAIDPVAARKIKSVPTWYFEGEDDKPGLLVSSRKLIDAIRAEGGQVRTTYYPNVGHNCWDLAYSDPKLYEWLLEQSLKSRPGTKGPAS